jgi:hypothetical protein
LERAARTASVTRAAPSWPAAWTDFRGVRPTDTPLLGGAVGATGGLSAGGVIPGGRVNVVPPLDSGRALTLLLPSEADASSRPPLGGASTVPAGAGVLLLSAGTVARPTAVRFAEAVPSASPSSTGFAEAPAAPDIACVSVIH